MNLEILGIIFYNQRQEFLELMFNDFTSDEYKKDSNYVKVLAYTNKTVNSLNNRIRKVLFDKPDLEQFVVNDDLMVSIPIVDDNGAIIYTVGTRLKVEKTELMGRS